jgi:hypothetical protein
MLTYAPPVEKGMERPQYDFDQELIASTFAGSGSTPAFHHPPRLVRGRL